METAKQAQTIANAIIPDSYKKATHFAVMFFYDKIVDLGMPREVIKGEPFLLKGIAKFHNGLDALDCYANTRCSASQLIEANSEEELQRKIEQMEANYKDENWLKENLYPYL